MATKHLYIVLTRSSTVLSQLIHLVKRDDYTHAALALDPGLEYMFSFGRRYPNNPFYGCFRRERLDDGVYAWHRELPGLVVELEVSEEQYRRAAEMIEGFLLDNHRYEYNYLALLGGLGDRLPESQNHFLCSEFVYHVLHHCGVADLGIPRSRVRPQDLLRVGGRIVFQGDLKHLHRLREVECPLHILPEVG